MNEATRWLGMAFVFIATPAFAVPSVPPRGTAAEVSDPSGASAADDHTSGEDEDEDEVSVYVQMDALTRYLWKGVPWTAGPVATATAEVSVVGCAFGAMSYHPMLKQDGGAVPYEVDAYAECSFDVGGAFSLGPTAELWLYPSTPGWWPVGYFAVTGAWDLGGIAATTTHGVMVGSAPGAYYGEVGLSWEEELGPITLGATTSFGWGNAAFMSSMVGVANAATNQIDLTLDASWQIGGGVAIVGGATIAALLDPAVQQAAGGSAFAAGRLGVAFSATPGSTDEE